MEEKNIISEEALEKAAGGLHLNKDTLKKCLIAGGVLAAAGAAGVGGYYLYNKKSGKKDAPAAAPASDTRYDDLNAAGVSGEEAAAWTNDFVARDPDPDVE